ncbi:MAG TPA: hypothetical protein VF456_10315 [Vicinamibacterales bacterium]
MRRTVFAAIAIAASAGLAAPLAAQSSMHNKYQSRETTITGCLEQTSGGGFRLTNAENLPSAAVPKGTSGMTKPEPNVKLTFDLKTSVNLNRHVGHKVEVTGYPETGTANQVKGTSGSTAQTQNFDVRSVKMVSSTCP